MSDDKMSNQWTNAEKTNDMRLGLTANIHRPPIRFGGQGMQSVKLICRESRKRQKQIF